MRVAVFAVVLVCVTACMPAAPVSGAQSGVIFMYHHVDATTPRSTSISPQDFDAQIAWLAEQGFSVLPLLELLEALASGAELPERSVAITFDDGYRSVLTAAAPRLAERDWPFTVFVNTEAIDAGYQGYLSWAELRRLGAQGATIGNHSVSHTHLVRELNGESRGDWQRRVRAEVTEAEQRLAAEVGDYLIPVFAYPYGEYTAEIKAIVRDQDLYALGQQSGAVGPMSDFYALPRYPVAEGLSLDDFAQRARSRALPASLVGAEQHILNADEPRPALNFAVAAEPDIRLTELACYASGQGRMQLEWQDESTVSARPMADLRVGRSKVNCTAPSASGGGVYYWYGHLWMRRLADGSWYDE